MLRYLDFPENEDTFYNIFCKMKFACHVSLTILCMAGTERGEVNGKYSILGYNDTQVHLCQQLCNTF